MQNLHQHDKESGIQNDQNFTVNELDIISLIFIWLVISMEAFNRFLFFFLYLEISELIIEDFKEVPKEYLTGKHEIVRRDAFQPNISSISPRQPTPRTVSLSQKLSTSKPSLALPRLSSSSVKPNKTVMPLSKTVSLVTAKVPTSGHATTEKPHTSTTQSQTTNRQSSLKPTHKPSTTTLPTESEKETVSTL